MQRTPFPSNPNREAVAPRWIAAAREDGATVLYLQGAWRLSNLSAVAAEVRAVRPAPELPCVIDGSRLEELNTATSFMLLNRLVADGFTHATVSIRAVQDRHARLLRLVHEQMSAPSASASSQAPGRPRTPRRRHDARPVRPRGPHPLPRPGRGRDPGRAAPSPQLPPGLGDRAVRARRARRDPDHRDADLPRRRRVRLSAGRAGTALRGALSAAATVAFATGALDSAPAEQRAMP